MTTALSFSDQELDQISELAAALPTALRADFLRSVAARVSALPEQARGPGLLHRIAGEAQRDILKGGMVAVGVSQKSGTANTDNKAEADALVGANSCRNCRRLQAALPLSAARKACRLPWRGRYAGGIV